MKHTKKIILGVAVAACSLATSAQEAPRTAYFLDGYTYRHELNPAFMGEHNYFAIPVFGNMDISLYSNMGVSTFLFQNPLYGNGTDRGRYRLTTFMSDQISANEFLGKLNNRNHINFQTDMTLLSIGFKAFKGFNTITVGTHIEAGVSLPKDFFRFMKLGQSNPEGTTYNFKDIQARANAVAEVALGHSHKINDKLTIGAKLKLLIGAGDATATVTDMHLYMGPDKWQVRAAGNVQMAAGPDLKVPTKAETGKARPGDKDADMIEWGDIKYNTPGIAGFGVGVDLGATYKLLPDLELSLAINDLGAMSWNNAVIASVGNGDTWTFDGFKNVTFLEDQPGYEENKISQQIDNMLDDLEDMFNIKRTGGKSYTNALKATLRVGAEYKMPFYKKLTAGFLFSNYFGGIASWTEGRLYANIKPVKWFDATFNYGLSTYGSSFGWMLNFHPRGFNLFMGTDHQVFNVTPQYVPVGHAIASVNFGLNVTF